MEAVWANEASSSSSSSSSSISTQFKYDVFLSFSGVDTRNNFTSHLLDALERHGFHTFRDDTKLNRGEYISDALLKAIEESKILLVVLSKKYGTSRWCLEELVKIMECKKTSQQIVLPIFYNVEPSDVREQKGVLAEAFVKHEERLKESSDSRVKKWREALIEVANLSGWDLPKVANGDEASLIRKAIKEVQNKLDLVHLHVACHEIGLESRIKKLKLLLKMESEDVRIVAVWGMGGIGKTTLVKKLYNLIQRKFEGSCFLANIRETSKQLNGLVVLQEQLLFDILGTGTHNLRNFHQGIEVIKRRALSRKVLLILDDVDDVQQLKALAIDRDSFGFGSRIVVITRDISLLNFLNVDEIYTAEELNKNESLELFSWHCFKEDHPTEDHLYLSGQVVHYAGGLPLALEILGRYFCGKSIPQWKSAIVKLRKLPNGNIQRKLEISFDSLSKDVQELFLDIACFFVGMGRDFTVKVLDGRNSFVEDYIQVLADRCLIKYDCNQLVKHDIVRDMGREIVRQESREDPGSRSRLWYREDVLEVLRYGTGTEAVKGLCLYTTHVQVNAKPLEKMDRLWYQENVLEVERDSLGAEAIGGRLRNLNDPKHVQVNVEAFGKMNNLWLLHLDYVHQTADFEHASRRLLWLSWKGFPLEYVSWNLSVENLIALDLRYSSLKKVWNGYKILDKLKFLYLSHCQYLTRTPDFSGLRSLEELLLNDCESLVEVDESVRCLNKLVVLDMMNCTKLRKLPSGIWMLKSLECLDLSGCSKLGNLAVFKGPLNKLRWLFFSSWTLPPKSMNSIGFSLTSVQTFSCLKELKLESCSLSHLPDEIANIISLQTLHLQRNNMSTLPDRIGNLTCLKRLDLGFNNVSHMPSEIGRLISLETCIITSNSLSTLPDSIGNLSCLKFLDVSGNKLSHLPSEIGSLTSLEYLNLNNCNLSYLPSELGRLVSLETCVITSNSLSTLPDSIGNLSCLKFLDVSGNKLSHLPSEIGGLTSLEYLNLNNCNLSYLPSEIGRLISLDTWIITSNSLSTLPDSIGNLSCLKFLDVSANKLSRLPSEIGGLTSLEYLNLNNCPSEIGRLVSLQTLELYGTSVHTLPESICDLVCLKNFRSDGCNLSHLPSEIGSLITSKNLHLGCKSLLTLPNSICNLTRLENLYLEGCNLPHLPSEIGNLVSLITLSLRGANICTLPDSIRNLHRLRYLILYDCAKLQSLPELPRGCGVSTEDCTSLESLPLELDQLGLRVFCTGSNKLVENDFANRLLKQLHRSKGLAELEEFVDIVVPTVSDVPIWFPYQGKGSSISFVVPPLAKKKILGWVICVFFTGPGEGVLSYVSVDHKVICNKIEKVVYPNMIHGFYASTCQDQVWLRYTPQGHSGLHLKDGAEVEISIVSHCALIVKNWAVDLIYEVDENITKTNENQEALIQYTPAL